MTTKRKKYYCCSECKSVDIKRDAWAVWDVGSQQWEVESGSLDFFYCGECDEPCEVEEMLL